MYIYISVLDTASQFVWKFKLESIIDICRDTFLGLTLNVCGIRYAGIFPEIRNYFLGFQYVELEITIFTPPEKVLNSMFMAGFPFRVCKRLTMTVSSAYFKMALPSSIQLPWKPLPLPPITERVGCFCCCCCLAVLKLLRGWRDFLTTDSKMNYEEHVLLANPPPLFVLKNSALQAKW